MLVGIDIGGTLTKVSIFDTLGDRPEQEVIETLGLSRSLLVTSHTIQQQNLDTFSSTTNGLYKKIHIILIETQKIPEIIDILVEKLSALKHNNGENTINDLLEREVGTNGLRITLTGGGAYKYKKLIDEKLTPLLNDTVGHYVNSNNNNSENVIVGGVDEVQALVFWADLSIASGTTTTNIPSDQIKSELGTFTYKDRDISELPGPSNIHIDQSTDATRSITDSKSFQLLASLELVPQTSDAGSEIYPYILCNVGTGVSILLVKDKDNYQRISGSGLGGGAFWGLCQLMTKYTNFDEAIVDSFLGLGDADKCDALVSDIYGDAYKALGLPGDLVAGFFAKDRASLLENTDDRDKVMALFRMVINNLAQISCFAANEHNAKSIYFSGGFLRDLDLSTASSTTTNSTRHNNNNNNNNNNKNHARVTKEIRTVLSDVVKRCMTLNVRFWAQGRDIRAYFFDNDIYLGALGAAVFSSK